MESRLPEAPGAKASINGQPLQELAEHIRKALPLPHLIARLELNQQAHLVEFTWQSRQFVVTPALEVFELKGTNLFITGSSMLIRASLAQQERMAKVIHALAESMEQVEALMKSRRFETGFQLLESVKQMIKRQIGKSNGGIVNRVGVQRSVGAGP